MHLIKYNNALNLPSEEDNSIATILNLAGLVVPIQCIFDAAIGWDFRLYCNVEDDHDDVIFLPCLTLRRVGLMRR